MVFCVFLRSWGVFLYCFWIFDVANGMLSASALCERKFLKVDVILGGHEVSSIPEEPLLGQGRILSIGLFFSEKKNGTEECE
jgi:hypothetical protein